MEWIIEGAPSLPAIAARFLTYLEDRKIVALYGSIGAGKTTFVKALCQQLGIAEDMVTSPTFSIVNEYTSEDIDIPTVFHLDLYRLESIEETLDIGIEDYLSGLDYCLVEWPEIIEPLLPEETVRIKMEIVDETTRKILFL